MTSVLERRGGQVLIWLDLRTCGLWLNLICMLPFIGAEVRTSSDDDVSQAISRNPFLTGRLWGRSRSSEKLNHTLNRAKEPRGGNKQLTPAVLTLFFVRKSTRTLASQCPALTPNRNIVVVISPPHILEG